MLELNLLASVCMGIFRYDITPCVAAINSLVCSLLTFLKLVGFLSFGCYQ
jgi:hypothetical protein